MSNGNSSTRGTAVITGASAGIGKVYADRLAARGYDLLLVARRADRLQAVAEEIQARYPVKVETLVADLAEPAGVATVVKRITGSPEWTMLVNNAGTSAVGPITETSDEVFTKMIALNITALTALTKAILPGFQQRNEGTLVNIGSVVGFAGYPWVPIYGGTKAYVQNFTQALQQQLAETKIRVQLVSPAATVSEIWDVCGVPLSTLDPGIVMTTENCVDAALRGLDKGELITAPSVQDESLLQKYETAAAELLQGTQNGQPAPRYGLRS